MPTFIAFPPSDVPSKPITISWKEFTAWMEAGIIHGAEFIPEPKTEINPSRTEALNLSSLPPSARK